MSTIAHARSHAVTHAWRGVVAGIVGGVVFGVLMAMMGMLTTIASMVGSDSAVVGGLVHLVISAGIGLVFGVLAGSFADRLWPVLGAGVVYGVLWWVLGPLIAMPMMLGMPLFGVDQTAMTSLMGHVVYGLVTAVALYGLSRREA
ncbi:putative membrane protein YagU involved in acid resistance [Spinactinospora alkalitolerans]|uniref:Putative membrane protein YagU involved in acid resistance n=1 Tax=Spinactinospora alkalitolerans TaxID=687207 RepID=A0A852TTL8_9ACTN|nr:hypothetical protein [Spinactinospora alkalitolerans]NYE45464.1 putative membrane protein YagU involved in acid resistance [Spinactinospora alkalitolerans]